MIFKTINDETTLSGQRIATSFTARKIAQEEATRQLEIDIQCLKNYEIECQKGTVSAETFATTMNGASVEAQRYASNIKNGTGSAQTFATNQKAIQTSMNETSIASKAAAVGINIFKAALNTLIFFAVIEGIQLLVKGIDSLILTAEEAEEKAENLRNNMQSFFDEVQSGQQTISSISDRFSELSKHVTETGENIDLTKDEYSEYLDICNQVKSIMPELVSGYTNEGNAIITLKDNVDSLTESYKENIRTKAAAFVTNGDDDGNTIQSFFDDYKIFTEGEGGLFAPSASGLWNNKSTDYEDYYGYDEVHEWLSEVADLSLKDLQNLQKGTTQATYLYALLKENGYELANITEDNYEAVHDVLDTRLTSLEGEMATRVSNVKMSLQQMLYADRDYWDIDNKEALSAIDSLFSSVDAEFIKQNNLLGQTALQSFESNVIRLFDDKNTQQAMIDIYAPQGIEESIEDYSKRVNNAIKNIQDYAKENKIDISLDFGDITGDVENLQKQYNDAIAKAKDKELDFDWNSWFKENSINTQEEIDRWNEIAESATNAADARKKYTEGEEGNKTDISWALSEENSKKIDDFQSKINTLKDALESINAGNIENDDLLDLMQTFPELQGASGNLENSIKSLVNTLKDDLLSSLGSNAPDELVTSIKSIANEINNINLSPIQKSIEEMDEVGGKLDSIANAFKDFNDNGNILNSIPDLQKVFGDLDGFDEFVQKATKAGITSKELDKCFDDLATEYLKSSDLLNDVTFATVEYVASALKEKGIVNGLEVAVGALGISIEEYNRLLEFAKIKNIDLANATIKEINQLINESNCSKDTARALAEYALKKEIANGLTLNTDGDISNLQNLCEQCGVTIKALDDLARAKAQLAKINSKPSNPDDMNTKYTKLYLENQIANAKKNAQKEAEDIDFSKQKNNSANYKANYDYSSVNDKNGKDKKDDSKYILGIEQALKLLQNEYDKVNTAKENLEKNGNKNYYKKEAEYITQLNSKLKDLESGYTKASNAYKKLYNKEMSKLDSKTRTVAKKMIETGTYDRRKFSSKNAEIIESAMDYYNNAYDNKQKAKDSKQSIKENNKSLVELEKERLNTLIETNNFKRENLATTKEKIKSINEEISYQKQLRNQELKYTQSKEESNKISADYEEKILSLKQELHQLQADEYQSQFDLLEAQKKDTTSTSATNTLIDKQLRLKKKILEEQLKTTKSTKDEKEMRQEYNDYVLEQEYEKIKNIDNLQSRVLDLRESELDLMQSEIDLEESKGNTISAESYDKVKEKMSSLIKTYKQLADEKRTQIDLNIKNGTYEISSERYKDDMDILNGYLSKVNSLNSSLYDLSDTIQNKLIDAFNKAIDRMNDAKDELDGVMSLLNSDNYIDDNGNITTDGNAYVSLNKDKISLDTAMMKAYDDEIERLNKLYQSGEIAYDAYIEKISEYRKAQMSLANEIKESRNNVLELQKDSLQAIADAYSKNTEATKKQFEEEEKLRKLRKQEKDDNESLAKLESKLAKLKISGTDADKNAIRELENKIRAKKEEQEEQIAENTYQAKIDELDKSNDAVQKATEEEINIISKSATKQKEVMNNMFNNVKNDYSNVLNKINVIGQDYSLSLSDTLCSPWKDVQTKTQQYFDMLQEYMDRYNSLNTTNLFETPTNSPVQLDSKYQVGAIGVSATNSVRDKINNILSNASANNAKSTSNLNVAMQENFGKSLTKNQMAELANIMLDGTYTRDDFEDSKVKNKLLQALIKGGYLKSTAHFKDGGIAKVESANSLLNGDHGLAFIRNDEAILSPFQTEIFKNFVPKMDVLSNTLKDFKPNTSFGKTIQVTVPLTIKDCVTNEQLTKDMKNMVYNETLNAVNDAIRKF